MRETPRRLHAMTSLCVLSFPTTRNVLFVSRFKGRSVSAATVAHPSHAPPFPPACEVRKKEKTDFARKHAVSGIDQRRGSHRRERQCARVRKGSFPGNVSICMIHDGCPETMKMVCSSA